MKKGNLNTSLLRGVQTYKGKSIEEVIEDSLENGVAIEKAAPIIYTEKKMGVIADYNVRTDRWEVAQAAREKVAASRLAKRTEAINNTSSEKSEEVGGPEPIQATENK
ncbi:hypothetical protein [Sigmofec virus UA08Rod_4888]|uniref:Uncharacterized protein n=1 Tax=Sigmofec virus UA08Rod_4888 TaxID=2929412 RepID=A0A976R813_9VIRU|nr:hypothetical protein [Sigmofec virus UA08Rod_4888]